jgi:hypothetical protein
MRSLFPLSPFPAVLETGQYNIHLPKYLLGAQLSISFNQAGLVPALQSHATAWASHCAIITQHLRMLKTVQVGRAVQTTA